jgi:hypothetical protein
MDQYPTGPTRLRRPLHQYGRGKAPSEPNQSGRVPAREVPGATSADRGAGTSWRQLNPAERHLSTHSASASRVLYDTGGDWNKACTKGGSSHGEQAYDQRHIQRRPLSSSLSSGVSPLNGRLTQTTSTNLYRLKSIRSGPLPTGSAAGQLQTTSTNLYRLKSMRSGPLHTGSAACQLPKIAGSKVLMHTAVGLAMRAAD